MRLDIPKKLLEEKDPFESPPEDEVAKRMEKDLKHDYKCQGCGRPATYNLQSQWHRYDITPEGDFVNEKVWEGDDNEWWCDDCANVEGIA